MKKINKNLYFSYFFALFLFFSSFCGFCGDKKLTENYYEGFQRFQKNLPVSTQGNGYLPKNLKKSDDMNVAAQKIMTHVFNERLKKHIKVIRTVERLNQKMGAEVSLSPSTEEGVEHKVSLQLKALEAKATLRYQGFVSADLNYKLDSQGLDLNVSKKVSDSTELIFILNQTSEETTNLIGLNYNW